MLSLSRPLLVVGIPAVRADNKKLMTSPGGVALACDPCASGSLVAHPRAFELLVPLPTVAMTSVYIHSLQCLKSNSRHS